MRRRAQLWLLVCLLGGCWSEDAGVDGLSAAQWDHLREVFTPPPAADPCRGVDENPSRCQIAATFGQQLFFDQALSSTGTVACATCHAPMTVANKTAWYTDLRTPNDVSMGASKWTAHNTISLVNIAQKEDLPDDGQRFFTWTGQCTDRPCTTAAAVINDIALPKAMGSTPAKVVQVITANPQYAWYHSQLFPAEIQDSTAFADIEFAFEAYMRRLGSLSTPFDQFITGDDSAIDDSAKRGFALFAGKAMCIECHRGPLLSDYEFHVTGVAQSGEHAPATDTGHDGTGAFYTAPLRQVAETGPYMHDGSLKTLADVIWFYRQGGAATGYVGTKDPLMQPVDITDDEARDLEAFLRTLTGTPVDSSLLTASGMTP